MASSRVGVNIKVWIFLVGRLLVIVEIIGLFLLMHQLQYRNCKSCCFTGSGLRTSQQISML